MSFIFVSHASDDKATRVRPLVEVLIAEGETVWIDRPGAGKGNFGFSQSYISRNDIDFLQSGSVWSTSIQGALREAGAVIGCLSRALLHRREVLEGELMVADTLGKLVTCIVDDLTHSELPQFRHGLLDLGKHQAPAINPLLLQQALELLPTKAVEQMPALLTQEWEKVRNLIASVNRVRVEPRVMRKQDVERIVPVLKNVQIGPILKIYDVPSQIPSSLASHLRDAKRREALLAQASTLVTTATPDPTLQAKMPVRLGSIAPLDSPGDAFWHSVFREAGKIARRTVAALILAPQAVWAFEQAGTSQIARDFVEKLKTGGIK